MSDKKAIVRAIDVGYGNVKFVTRHDKILDPVTCSKFPSSAPVSRSEDLGAGMMSKRSTVNVEVNGVIYEVGPDVGLAQEVFEESANLNEGFALSDGYMARTLGALHYMATASKPYLEYIDLLVLGLPISTYDGLKSKLEKKMKGIHHLPHGREIDVKRVVVLPQPLGAFYNHMYVEAGKDKAPELMKQMNLIVDPGSFTFDWLLALGMKTNTRRSGTVNRGMSAIVKSISEDVAKKYNTNQTVVYRVIETSIRDNTAPKLFSEEFNISDYMARATPIITEALAAMSNKVGDGADIENIILVGGGATTYLPELQKLFPRHNIVMSNNSLYANVVGFQVAGERHMLSEQSKALKVA